LVVAELLASSFLGKFIFQLPLKYLFKFKHRQWSRMNTLFSPFNLRLSFICSRWGFDRALQEFVLACFF